jgi:phosphoribosylformylglycinamidine cyclo-ligase
MPIPPIFQLIQANSGANAREMYQVFNMGHRLEIFTESLKAETLISIAKSLGIDAQVIGRVEICESKELVLKGDFGTEVFSY